MSASTLINRFRSNESGTTAIIFGVSVVAMLGALGAAMDISRAVSEKSRVQTVADIASLQAARSLDGDDAQLLLGAQAVFAQHFPSGSPATVTGVVRNGDAVTVEAESRVDTYLAGFLGFDEVPVSVESTSTFAVNDVDIALVLDTTGSMAGSKMAALKTAAGELIDTLEAVDGDGIRLSVVPFAQHVNVGLSRAGADWLDVPADRTTPASRECRLERPVIGRSNCRTVYATGYSDGVPFDYSYQSCDKQYGEEQEVCRDRAERTDIWQGCVGSRDEPLDTQAAFAGERIPGVFGTCGTELQPLTTSFSSARSTINALVPSGDTYMPSGVLWGWRTLDESVPLKNNRAATSDRVLVLMTDGQNTRSKSGDRHDGWDQNDANRKTRELCQNVKASDVTVYTIAYGVTDGTTQSLLRNCASNASKAFSASNASDLTQAFKDIADAVTSLRVTS